MQVAPCPGTHQQSNPPGLAPPSAASAPLSPRSKNTPTASKCCPCWDLTGTSTSTSTSSMTCLPKATAVLSPKPIVRELSKKDCASPRPNQSCNGLTSRFPPCCCVLAMASSPTTTNSSRKLLPQPSSK